MPKSKIAIVWRGDREARSTATPENTRLRAIFAALAAEGFAPEPAVFAEEVVDEVRAQLLGAKGVLVFVDPLSNGRTRDVLDPLLREVAARGVWVSAHPDTILKMGTKEVLFVTNRSAGVSTPGSIGTLRNSRGSFRMFWPRRVRACSSRIAAMAGRMSGRSSFRTAHQTRIRIFGFFMPNEGVSNKRRPSAAS